MTSLLRLKLPLSTNFGNAKPSTRGLPCAKARDIGSPSARNADFGVTQTRLSLAWLGQRRNPCSLGENQATRTKISALIHNGFFTAEFRCKMIPDLGQAFSCNAFRRGGPSHKTHTSLKVNGEMPRIVSSTISGRKAGGAARCGQAGRSQSRQLIPIGVASRALKSRRLA
jgi:hypothetical protein